MKWLCKHHFMKRYSRGWPLEQWQARERLHQPHHPCFGGGFLLRDPFTIINDVVVSRLKPEGRMKRHTFSGLVSLYYPCSRAIPNRTFRQREIPFIFSQSHGPKTKGWRLVHPKRDLLLAVLLQRSPMEVTLWRISSTRNLCRKAQKASHPTTKVSNSTPFV